MNQEQLGKFVLRQLESLYPPDPSEAEQILLLGIPAALERIARCFAGISAPLYRSFDPWRGSHYAMFLYYLSNSLVRAGRARAGEKVYLLNRALHAVDLLHEVVLPEVWILDHPLGTVMGRATYGSHFAFAQSCTVGNVNGVYPVIGRGVTMSSGSSILGNSRIGDFCILGSGTLIKNESIPPFSLVFGQSPNLVIRPRAAPYFVEQYKMKWADMEHLVAESA